MYSLRFSARSVKTGAFSLSVGYSTPQILNKANNFGAPLETRQDEAATNRRWLRANRLAQFVHAASSSPKSRRMDCACTRTHRADPSNESHSGTYHTRF